MRLFLCDDNAHELSFYREKLESLAEKHKIDLSVFCFRSGAELLFALDENTALYPDIVYLDILMPEMDGIETGLRMREGGCSSELVYLTVSRDFAVESFDTSPLHYIVKDKTGDAGFERIFLRAVKKATQKKEGMFTCRVYYSLVNIPCQDILYFKVEGALLSIMLISGKKLQYFDSLSSVKKQLHNWPFLQTHRSYIVNMDHVQYIRASQIVLFSGQSVPVGARYQKTVKTHLGQFVRAHAE